MGLKGFHLVFIVASILLSIFFGLWAYQAYGQYAKGAYLMTALVSFLISVGLMIYMFQFIKKVKP